MLTGDTLQCYVHTGTVTKEDKGNINKTDLWQYNLSALYPVPLSVFFLEDISFHCSNDQI